MKKIESEKKTINCSQEKIFNFLSDFNNFGLLMPEQIINWQSTEKTCSFTIKGLADLSMRISEVIPYNSISITSGEKTPFSFTLECLLEKLNNEQTETQLIFNANLNPMLSMMASKPLENLVNILNDKLKVVAEEKGFME